MTHQSATVKRSPSKPRATSFRYPGPRPLRRGDSQLLVGRAKDVAKLAYQIYSYPVVEITAPSGTGKSSLLAAGVIPALEDYGFTVVTLRSWAEVRGDSDSEYYYHALRRAFVETPPKAGSEIPPVDQWPGGADEGLPWITALLEGGLVVIFDQLEELMRVDAPRSLRFLESVVRMAREGRIRQVLSLRAEFKSQLSVVESRLGIRQWQWYSLEEVDQAYVADIIRAPREVADQSWSVDPKVEKAIADCWLSAKEQDPGVGLLHLQALLWVLEQEIGTVGKPWTQRAAASSAVFTRLTTEDAKLRAEAVTASLGGYVSMAMDHFAQDLDVAGRPAAGAETKFAAARFVDDLSSAGYKTPMSVDDLFLRCYDGLQDLEKDRRQLSRLRRLWEATDSLGSDPDTLRAVAEARLADWRRPGDNAGGNPLLLRDRFFSGRLWRSDALTGLCEMEVVFQRALEWLETCGIVRITPATDGVPVVTLIHDGFGPALNAWAEEMQRDPAFFFTALVGESGTSVLGGTEDAARPVVGTELGVTADALQWSGCSIDYTDFRDVTFRNCDFRGTVFYGCGFDNVSFVNCYLPGALFIQARVSGGGLRFDDTITRTVSFIGGGAEGSAKLEFAGVRAAQEGELADEQFGGTDGLFLEGFAGDWEIKDSAFMHLTVVRSGHGVITDSQIQLVHFDGLPSQVKLVRATAKHVVSEGFGGDPAFVEVKAAR